MTSTSAVGVGLQTFRGMVDWTPWQHCIVNSIGVPRLLCQNALEVYEDLRLKFMVVQSIVKPRNIIISPRYVSQSIWGS